MTGSGGVVVEPTSSSDSGCALGAAPNGSGAVLVLAALAACVLRRRLR